MAQIGPIKLVAVGADEASESITSLREILSPLDLSELPPCLFDDSGVLIADFSDLVFREPLSASATGAGELYGVKFEPSDWYLELCATIVGVGDKYVSRVGAHGWPILSLGCSTPSVTGSRAGSNPCPVEGA